MLIFFERHLIALPDKAQERILTYCFPSFRQKFPSVSIPIWSSLVSSPQKHICYVFPFSLQSTFLPLISFLHRSQLPLSPSIPIFLFLFLCFSTLVYLKNAVGVCVCGNLTVEMGCSSISRSSTLRTFCECQVGSAS